MNLFHMKSLQQGQERMPIFLRDNFVSIDCPGIENLETIDLTEFEHRLAQVDTQANRELIASLREIDCFVYTMKDGDLVLIADADTDVSYLGDVGDYYYIEQDEDTEGGLCHRRGITWLNQIPKSELNAEVQALIQHHGKITQFMQPIETAGLGKWVPNHMGWVDATPVKPLIQAGSIDPKTIHLAMTILTAALHSDNADRRERAAIAILQYAKPATSPFG